MTGMTIAIDAMTEIYRAALGAKSIGTLTDPSGKPTIHINVILANVLEFQRQGVNQIWVFDHNQDPNKDFHNPLKLNELAKRQKRKTTALDKIQSLKDLQTSDPLFSDDEDEDEVNESKDVDASAQSIEPAESTQPTQPVENKLVPPEEPPAIDEIVFTPAEVTKMKSMSAKDKMKFRLAKHVKLTEDYEEAVKAYNEEFYKIKPQDKINALEKQSFSATKDMINDVKLILNCLNIKWIEAPAGFEGEAIASWLNATSIADAVFSGDTDPIAYGATTLFRRNPRDKKIYEYTLEAILKQMNEETAIEDPDVDDFRRAAIALGTDVAEKTPGVGEKTILKKLHTIELTESQEKAMEEFKKVPDESSVVINNNDKQPFVDCFKDQLIEWLVVERGFNKSRITASFDKPVKSIKSKPAKSAKSTKPTKLVKPAKPDTVIKRKSMIKKE